MKVETVEGFAEELKATFALPGPAAPEDQLKGPVADLLKKSGTEFGLVVATRTETHLSEHKVRPDLAAYAGGLIAGYVELKAPGLGADPLKLKGKHNKEQWEKLKALPNLIYTDGRDWALYRNGERQGAIVKLDGDPTDRGAAAVTKSVVDDLDALIRDFLYWTPNVPHSPPALAKYLAPLTRFLRAEVEQALQVTGSDVSLLAAEWRQYFFPEADDHQFADAYAQTVTYAMLLARLSGADDLAPAEAAKTLNKGNGLLAEALKLLGQDAAREELRVGFELLQRSLEALSPADFLKSKPELWLYFYEDFLAAYDPKLRKDFGVYYTPREVVELQVRLASELLEKRFAKKLGFADDGVVFLDPAVGTGTYLVATVKHALERVKDRSGAGAVPGRAAQMAANMYGFELLVGPYAVAHLRLTQALEGSGAKLSGRLKVYLADTLESPEKAPPGGLDLTHKALTQEHEAARDIKKGGEILVCLGNPPYDRQRIEDGDTSTQRKGGWVRFGDQIKGGAKQEELGHRPIFDDFLEPARKSGAGVHLQVMYNDYLYFWRWALWRLFEQQSSGGIVTFITASSYLAGPGFVGVREVMRKTFDEMWIIDLGGDNLGTRKTPNVFNIQTPVAIAVGIRTGQPSPDTPAKAWYTKIEGPTRNSKLEQLADIAVLADLPWKECNTEWQAPLLPKGKGDYFDWPEIADLFPWAHTGAMLKRSWVISHDDKLLDRRWKKLVTAPVDQRPTLLKETRDRKASGRYESLTKVEKLKPISELTEDASPDGVAPYHYRSFDRQFVLLDNRVGDFFRPQLVAARSDKQLFLVCLRKHPLGRGPGIHATIHLPDVHSFRGSYGGTDILPIYRDAAGAEPNVTAGLLDGLSKQYGIAVTPEDLAAYVSAIMGGLSYTERFWNELETPGPRVPLTKDGSLFSTSVELGRRLIWLQTLGERFVDADRGDQIPAGTAKCLSAVSDLPAAYPDEYVYDAEKYQLRVGNGAFGPVTPEMWNYEVSGLPVIDSWLGYRMKVRAGKKSSPLDAMSPERWTPRMTDDLLELLWVLEAVLDSEAELSSNLGLVLASSCFSSSELPQPTAEERKAPGAADEEPGDLLSLMVGDSEDD